MLLPISPDAKTKRNRPTAPKEFFLRQLITTHAGRLPHVYLSFFDVAGSTGAERSQDGGDPIAPRFLCAHYKLERCQKMTSITPDQIKAIAKTVKTLESDTYGVSLAHTTLCNAVTRALGLGNTYRDFKASFDSDIIEVEDSSELLYLDVSFIFDQTDEYEVFDDAFCTEVNQLLCNCGYDWAVCDLLADHGFEQVVLAPKSNPNSTEANAAIKHAGEILDILKDMFAKRQRNGEERKMRHSYVCEVRSNDEAVHIDFIYNGQNQICTSTIKKKFWDKRAEMGFTDEEAVLIFGGDCEIFEEYTKDSIQVIGNQT